MRKSEDAKFVGKLCAEGLETEVTIKVCRRLKAEKDKPRPLLVSLQSGDQVSQVLRSARKLRDIEAYKSVHVKKDMTPLERAQMKDLLGVRNRKREEATKAGRQENWVIRGGKVVNIQRQKLEEAESMTFKPAGGAQTPPAAVAQD